MEIMRSLDEEGCVGYDESKDLSVQCITGVIWHIGKYVVIVS